MSTPVTTKLVATRNYPQVGTIGQTPMAQSQNLIAINNILQLALRNTSDTLDSVVRVSDLVALGFISLEGNVATATITGGGGTTYTGADSVSVSGTVIQLVSDASTPGNSYYYGTNSSGTKGWYTLPGGGSGTVTSVGLAAASASSLVVSGTTSPITSSGTFDIALSGDASAPGNSYFYGTNSSGTKGWYALPYASALTFADSVVNTAGTVTLVGDSATPGNTMYYGTNSSGTRGWYNAPTFERSATWVSAGAVLSAAGAMTVAIHIPYGCTLKQITILTSGGAGSCSINLWKAAFASYPPTSGGDITGASPPGISAATTFKTTSANGVGTSCSTDDVILCTLASTSIFTMVSISLRFQ